MNQLSLEEKNLILESLSDNILKINITLHDAELLLKQDTDIATKDAILKIQLKKNRLLSIYTKLKTSL